MNVDAVNGEPWTKRQWALAILLLCLFIDAGFVELHRLYSEGLLLNERFRLDRDRGFAECFQYLKFLTAAVLLLLLAKRYQSSLLLGWGALSVYLLLDDSLQIHEWLGGELLGSVVQPYVELAYHQGKVVYGLLAAVVIVRLGRCYWLAAPVAIKQMSYGLLTAMILLWISAVVVDNVQQVWMGRERRLLGVLLEEGGEHLAASLFLYYCVAAFLGAREWVGVDAGADTLLSD